MGYMSGSRLGLLHDTYQHAKDGQKQGRCIGAARSSPVFGYICKGIRDALLCPSTASAPTTDATAASGSAGAGARGRRARHVAGVLSADAGLARRSGSPRRRSGSAAASRARLGRSVLLPALLVGLARGSLAAGTLFDLSALCSLLALHGLGLDAGEVLRGAVPLRPQDEALIVLRLRQDARPCV